ncbi:hypothetical protein ACA910_003689 [Epithemia clementina (nom. ined.)]
MGNQYSRHLVNRRNTNKAKEAKSSEQQSRTKPGQFTLGRSFSNTAECSRSCSTTTDNTESSLDQRRLDRQAADSIALTLPNEKAVFAWVRAIERHDIDAVIAMTDNNCQFNFVDSGMEMLATHFYESLSIVFASLPDMRFHYKTIKSIDDNRVLVDKFFGYGTHTGAPYSFGPYPPIEAKGAKFRDPPVEMTLTIKDGKITHFVCDAKGTVVGPPGIYEQLGGIIL